VNFAIINIIRYGSYKTHSTFSNLNIYVSFNRKFKVPINTDVGKIGVENLLNFIKTDTINENKKFVKNLK
jgi:hypothetical protein